MLALIRNEMTVAIAAPRIPCRKRKMRVASRKMLLIAPMRMMFIAVFAAPSERMVLLFVLLIAKNGAPMRMM